MTCSTRCRPAKPSRVWHPLPWGPPARWPIWDWGVGVGGPIKKDRLWFYAANRWWGAQEILPGAYWNATPHTPFYTPDLNRPAFNNNFLEDQCARSVDGAPADVQPG